MAKADPEGDIDLEIIFSYKNILGILPHENGHMVIKVHCDD